MADHGDEGPSCENTEATLVALFRQRDGRADLYESLETARSGCPVHRSDGLGQWVLTGYHDVRRALQDRSFAVDFARQMDVRRPDWRDHPALAQAEHLMLSIDGPNHDRLRKIGLARMNVRLVQRKAHEIRSTVQEVVSGYVAAGGGDFVAGVALPVTTHVISDIMGLPREDREWYRLAGNERVLAFDPSATDHELRRADAAALEILAYWRELVRRRQVEPADDLLSDLLAMSDEEDHLSPEEVASFADFLFSAGFDTTVHTLGLGMLAFLEHPDELERLRRDPGLGPSMVEEVLRYTTTIVGQPRSTAVEVRVGDVAIPASQVVFCALAGANRDPEAFRDPHRFDIGRDGPANVTFGHGRHMCLGAPLARVEIQMVFEELVASCGQIRLTAAPMLDRRLAPRGLTELVLHVEPMLSTVLGAGC